MRRLLEKFKLKKIEAFLVIGFIISSYSFSMLIGYCSDAASQIIERNKFHKQYKEVTIIENDPDKFESINEIIDITYDLGIHNFTSKYLVTAQEPVKEEKEDVLRNEVLGAYGKFDFEKHCEIEGRNFTKEELVSDSKVAIIGERLDEYTYEINNEKYVKLFGDDYKVIGRLKNTKNFKATTIVPFKSFNFANNTYDRFGLNIDKDEYKNIYKLDNEKYTVEVNDLPIRSVISYLYDMEEVFKECIFQLVLSIANLILFSIFIANSMKKDIAIMKVLGCTNKDVFEEILKKNLKITTIGNLIGIVLFRISSRIIDVAYFSKMSQSFIINILLSSIVCYLISMIISIVTLRNVIKFKLIKEIR